MADPLPTLAEALRERLLVIQDRDFYRSDPGAHLEALKEVSSRIHELQAALPANTDPMLQHYLERRSYDKALAWIEDSLGAHKPHDKSPS